MATSAQGLARTNRKALEGALYSPDDPSVRGDSMSARMKSNCSGIFTGGGSGQQTVRTSNACR